MTKIDQKKKMKIRQIKNSKITALKHKNAVDKVQAVTSVKKTDNQSSSNSHFNSIDDFYHNMKTLTDEYKNYYNKEQTLEKSLKSFSLEDSELLKQIQKFINDYNGAIKALKIFDFKFSTSYIYQISMLLLKFDRLFGKVGIQIETDKTLALTNQELLLKNPDVLKEIFIHEDFIKNIMLIFQNVKAKKDETSASYNGSIIDEKI